MQATASWQPVPGTQWTFNIDLIGGCNLACPSCPVGNMKDVKVSKGVMPPELLEKIVCKAIKECGSVDFGLYNWSEPFLHPDLAQMIRIIKSHNSSCSLSTNLNIIKNLDNVLLENPDHIKVSLSGFYDQTYSQTHKNGDIELVKKNMIELAAALKRTQSKTKISIGFHRYLGNHEEEYLMQEFSESLGFKFGAQWAYLIPLEKVMAFVDPDHTDQVLTNDDRQLIDRLALPLDEALKISRESPIKSCRLRDHYMTMNALGDVMLCCVVYDEQKYGLGSYLDHSLEELQEMKFQHQQCVSCMDNGLHKLFTYEDSELDTSAINHIHKHYPGVKLSAVYDFVSPEKQGRVMAFARKVKNYIKESILQKK